MNGLPTDAVDRQMMERCIALSARSGEAHEYPYGAVIRRGEAVVAESINRVAHEGDVTRHAEIVAIGLAQQALAATSLDDCTIYINAEPCAACCYAIRESRMRRVVYGLRSPHMGGVSKWNVLTDQDLSTALPEVFAPPPEIIAGFMAHEAEQALRKWNALAWAVMKERGIFIAGPLEAVRRSDTRGRLTTFLRRVVFDRFGRR